jgi:hypothetical protein
MLRNLGVTLFVITVVLISHASATTFYSDQTKFLKDASALGPVGPLGGNVMETDVFTTGTTRDIPFDDCCIAVSSKPNPPRYRLLLLHIP